MITPLPWAVRFFEADSTPRLVHILPTRRGYFKYLRILLKYRAFALRARLRVAWVEVGELAATFELWLAALDTRCCFVFGGRLFGLRVHGRREHLRYEVKVQALGYFVGRGRLSAQSNQRACVLWLQSHRWKSKLFLINKQSILSQSVNEWICKFRAILFAGINLIDIH